MSTLQQGRKHYIPLHGLSYSHSKSHTNFDSFYSFLQHDQPGLDFYEVGKTLPLFETEITKVLGGKEIKTPLNLLLDD